MRLKTFARSSLRISFSGFAALIFLSGCGGNNSGSNSKPPPAISVSVSPATLSLSGGGTQAFSATVSNDSSNAGVTWSIGTGVGTLSASSSTGVTYTAPSVVGAAATVTLTATSNTDGTKSAAATITLNPIVVTFSTVTTGITLDSGQTLGLTAAVASDSSASGATFTVSSAGTVNPTSAAGNAPATTLTATGKTASTVTVTATSVKDITKSASTAAIVVNPALTITTAAGPLTAAQISTAYSGATIAASGGTAPIAFAIASGSLPTGLTLNSSTGVLSGTPTGSTGTSTFSVKATDSATTPVSVTSGTYTIAVSPVSLVWITSGTLATGTVGTAYTQTLASTGGTGAITYTLNSGTLPVGLAISGGAITGTPTAPTPMAGDVITIKATDSATPTPFTSVSGSLTLIVNPVPLAITSASLPSGTVNSAYSYQLTSTGGTGAITWSLTGGTLPTGISLSAGGLLSGTPTTTASGMSLTFKAADSAANQAQSVTATLALTIASAATISSVAASAGSGQTAIISSAFATALQALVNDASGNAVANVTVAFSAPSSGASGTFANGTATTTAATNSSGVATASAFTANNTAGSYSVTASVSGVIATGSFSLTNSTSTPSLSFNLGSGGSYIPGQQDAIYTITVSNAFDAAETTGTVAVTDPPTGFAVTAIAGANWTCVLTTETCTTTTALPPGQSYPPIVVAGNVTAASGDGVSVSVEISGGGMTNQSSATGSVPVLQPAAATAPLTNIAIDPAHISLAPAGTAQLSATGTYQDGSTQALTSAAAWASSNTAIATVSLAGVVTAVSAGTATITAMSGQIVGTATVNVMSQPPSLTKFAISPIGPSMALGTSLQFSATGIYSDGSTRDLTKKVAWASTADVLVSGTETPVAKVSLTGLATATAVGSTYIVAGLITAPGQLTQVESQLTVTGASIQSITVSPSAPSIPQGYLQQFDAVATLSDGTTQDVTQSAQWASTNTAVATIGSSSGLAMSAGQGTTTITAALGTQSSSATLTVTSAQLVGLTVTPPNAFAAAGTPQPFQAWGNFSDGSYQNMTQQVVWSSSAPAIAIVDDTGAATGESAGAVTITAASGTIIGTANLTVTVPQCLTVAVFPADASIPAGSVLPFSATCAFSDGSTQNITQSVAWSSSSPGMATIDNSQTTNGQATAIAPGTTTITAEYDPLSGPAVFGPTTLTVTQPAPPLTHTYLVTITSKSVQEWTLADVLIANGNNIFLPLFAGGQPPCFPYGPGVANYAFLPTLVVTNGQWTPANTALDIDPSFQGVESCAGLLEFPGVIGSESIGYSAVSADGTLTGYAWNVGSNIGAGLASRVFETWTANLNTGYYSYYESGGGSGPTFLPQSWCSDVATLAPYCPFDNGLGWNLAYSYWETGTFSLTYTQIDQP